MKQKQCMGMTMVVMMMSSLAAYGSVEASDTISQNKVQTIFVGTDAVKNSQDMPDIRNSLVSGTDNTLANHQDGSIEKALILGTDNHLTGNMHTDKYVHNVIMMGSENTIDFAKSGSPYHVITIGDKNSVISDPDQKPYVNGNILIGESNTSKGAVATMVGRENTCGSLGVAMGAYNVSANHSVAIGYHATSVLDSSTLGGTVAVGHTAEALADNSVAVGYAANVASQKTGGVALGMKSKVDGDHGVALGTGSVVNAVGGMALGAGSVVTKDMHDQYGYNFQTQQSYAEQGDSSPAYAKETTGSVSVGDSEKAIYRRVTNVAAGKDNVDAVNVGQLKDAMATLATGVAAATDTVQSHVDNMHQELETLGTHIGAVQNQVHQVQNESNAGIANVAALSALRMQPTTGSEKVQLMAGIGFHGGKQSIALGAGYRVSDTAYVTVGIARGAEHKTTGNLGLSWRVGSGQSAVATQSTEVQALRAEMQEVKKALKAQSERNAQLEKMVMNLMSQK